MCVVVILLLNNNLLIISFSLCAKTSQWSKITRKYSGMAVIVI